VGHGRQTGPSIADTQRPRSVLILVCAAQFVLQLDFSIVNVALHTIQLELHIAAASLQWLITGYALSYGSLLLLGGRIGDLVGRRHLLMVGLVVFGLSSLVCGVTNSPVVLIGARFVQGSGGALIAPSALALLTRAFDEGQPRIRALSAFQASTAAGAATGIFAGGLLTQYIGWRAVFLVNLPIIAILLTFAPIVLPRDRVRHGSNPDAKRLDVTGAILVTAAIAALIFGLSDGQQNGFSRPTTVVALAVAGLLATMFVVVEKRVAEPMLPLSILADPARRAALTTLMLTGAVLVAYVYFVTLYLQGILGFSAVRAGVYLVPSTIAVLLSSALLARRLLTRFGTRVMLMIGLTSILLAQIWLSQMSASDSYLYRVFPALLLSGLGMGTAIPAASVAVTTGVAAGDQGLAGGLFVTAQQVGAAIGLAVLATIAAARTHATGGNVVAGYQASFRVATGIVLLAMLVVMLLLRRRSPAAEASLPDSAVEEVVPVHQAG
jgi:EmrB/QacA subfamily drug resistance transporter